MQRYSRRLGVVVVVSVAVTVLGGGHGGKGGNQEELRGTQIHSDVTAGKTVTSRV